MNLRLRCRRIRWPPSNTGVFRLKHSAMHQRLALLAAVLTTLAQPARLDAQEHDHQHKIGQLGRVVFPVSCTPQARQRFEHAMAVLHSFWWEEGDRAFGEVLEADSSYNSARLKTYADSMARLYQRFPKDVEVAIYYALSQLATAPRTDTTFAQQKRAIAILEPLFAHHPDHPGLAHYVIHATDSPGLARLGLDAARRYAKIAPAAPHAQHMPSHIFVRLGLWNETIASNWKSYQAGYEYARARGIAGTMEEFHAMDYAVYGYLQRGQDSAARAAVTRAMRAKPSLRGLVSDYNRTAMAARVPLERGDWAAAAELRAPAESLGPVASALFRFTRAIGSARSGRAEAARPDVKALDSIATALEQKGEPYWSRVVQIKHDVAEAWVRW